MSETREHSIENEKQTFLPDKRMCPLSSRTRKHGLRKRDYIIEMKYRSRIIRRYRALLCTRIICQQRFQREPTRITWSP
jgi:hypothetical protein